MDRIWSGEGDRPHMPRVLGHVIGGVRATYDRYEYLDEKRDALASAGAFG
jgi:hypothetical protein